MSYIPSINIENNRNQRLNYIVTANAKNVLAGIIDSYKSGIHSFTLIGTYGTGKSSFLLALERDLLYSENGLVDNKAIFNENCQYEFLNVVGDYERLNVLIGNKIGLSEEDNFFKALDRYYQKIAKKNKMLFIMVDEFGKILEYAANHEPERELYFLQKLSEYVNTPSRNIILLTTLHQNFSAYASKLSEAQKNEWTKVRGRFKDLVFHEPVEQLLYLVGERTLGDKQTKIHDNARYIYSLAKESKFITSSLNIETANRLYPLDAFSASCLVLAFQKYGQNERTLFSFLAQKGKYSLSNFKAKTNLTYSVADVYDYITRNLYNAVYEAKSEATNWNAMKVAIEKVHNGIIPDKYVGDCEKVVKTIGLLNLLGSAESILDKKTLCGYAEAALGIAQADKVIDELISAKIVRFAVYKSKYILFEGTDINIEEELYKANTSVPMPTVSADELETFFEGKFSLASGAYYVTGTPRYFKFILTDKAFNQEPIGDIDGFVNILFPKDKFSFKEIVEESKKSEKAIIYVVFKNAKTIQKHLFEIVKLQYLLAHVVFDDVVAKREVKNQISYETAKINTEINKSLLCNDNVAWIYKGKDISVNSLYSYNRLLSKVFNEVYSKTPIMRNELFNKHKLSSSISLARNKLLDAIVENSEFEDLKFDKNTFPPEKTIYYTLLKQTGMHRLNATGSFYEFGEPEKDSGIYDLWQVCREFLETTKDKPRKIKELIKTLSSRPYKLKQGFIDLWIPIWLFANRQNFALYNEDGIFIVEINHDVFDLMRKMVGEYSIKAYNQDGIKNGFFNVYRKFLHKRDDIKVESKDFVNTVMQFLYFYKHLDSYAKNTHRFDNPSTLKFRDALAKAKDPEKTFFTDIPKALGYMGDCEDEEFLNSFLGLIKRSVHELSTCYDAFICRIENCVVNGLGLSQDYDSYKGELENRYKNVKQYLLSPKTKSFLERIMTPSRTKKEFYERIGSIVYDKKLEETLDSEEEYLIDNILYMFRELDRYSKISESENGDSVFNIEMASNRGGAIKSQTFRLPEKMVRKASDVEKRIKTMLSGDDNLDTVVLIKMLNERLGKKNG